MIAKFFKKRNLKLWNVFLFKLAVSNMGAAPPWGVANEWKGGSTS